VTEHDQIQELLAGYALGSLSGPDALAADRALADHVPGCAECRDTLDAFGSVAGDLGLAAEPLPPPDLLLARIHREMDPRPRRRPGAAWVAAAAAGIVALFALGGQTLTSGGTSATLAAADIQQAVAAAAAPGAETRDLGAVDEVAMTDRSGFYLYGEGVPPPPPGYVYRLWLIAGDEAHYVGTFMPDPTGVVAIQVAVEGAYDDVIVTTEHGDTPPGEPSGVTWSAVAETPAA
jgi:hypothetical protein